VAATLGGGAVTLAGREGRLVLCEG
jgi:hypothetical protein